MTCLRPLLSDSDGALISVDGSSLGNKGGRGTKRKGFFIQLTLYTPGQPHPCNGPVDSHACHVRHRRLKFQDHGRRLAPH